MNILFTAAESSISGANKSMCILIKNIRKHNNNVFVVLPNKGDIEKELKERHIEYFVVKSKPWTVDVKTNGLKCIIKSMKRQIYNFKAIRRIKKIIKEKDIDIVHNNSISAYVGPVAGKKGKCKVIWHIREFLEEDHGLKICKGFNHKKIINSSDKIITISKCVYNKYCKIYNKDKMIMIYNGINTDEFLYKKCFDKDKKIKIACIGRISEGKGQMELVKSIKLLDKKYKNKIEVYLVGNDNSEYAKKIKNFVQKNSLNDLISFTGNIYDIKEFYKKIDIVIVSSRNEAFGRTTIEAMLESCLVIGANTGGTEELIKNEKYGLLYDQGSEESLAKKICWAIDNEKIVNNIIENALVYAKDNFTGEKNAYSVLNVYNELK